MENEQDALAKVFTEWHRRWVENPREYQTDIESYAQPDDEYGDSAARYFIRLRDEMEAQRG